MRRIAYILFLIPFFGFSQFNMDITAINLEDDSQIPNVHFTIGALGFSGDSDGRAKCGTLDTKYLEQTLQITHGNFKFEERALYQHEYEVVGNTLMLIVYGRPWKQKQINIDLALAKSKKVRNDTVHIDYGYHEMNALISFEPSSEINHKNATKLPPFKRAFDDLVDGNYVLTFDYSEVRIPFQKEDWTQMVCFYQPKETHFAERELNLLRTYFNELEASERLRRKKEREHLTELYDLQQEIDELSREIDRLKGIPVAYRPDYPEPIEMEELDEVLIYSFENSEAEPPNGYDGFTSDIQQLLADVRVKYSGNITFEIMVQKDGKLKVSSLHSGSADKLIVLERIDDYLKYQRWSPANFQGLRIDFAVVVSLNVVPQGD
ncbi:MAG: hypothetical protein AB8B56_03915 [Crocinitomicaceae bacterium]